MGILSSLFFSDKSKSASKKTIANKIIPYFPNDYNQDPRKSVVDANNRYDLRRFSRHEADTIRSILQTVDKKYPKAFRSLGLANESYPITYKARYVLFDIIIIRYEKSENPIDKLAVAFAYESKGAYYREQALEYFESAIKDIDNSTLNSFVSYSAYQTYLKFSSLYEREHNYKKSISYMKRARASKGASKEFCTGKIEELEKKLEKPPRTAKRKKPEYYDAFEADVRRAAIAFVTGDFSGIELNVRPNK